MASRFRNAQKLWKYILYTDAVPSYSRCYTVFPVFTDTSVKIRRFRWNVFSHSPARTPLGWGGAYEIRNFCFQSPSPRHTGFDLNCSTPPLWWLTGLHFWWGSLNVKVDKTYRYCCHFYSQWCNFYSWWWNLEVVSCVYLCKFCHWL